MRETAPLDLTAERWRRLEALFHAALDLRSEQREDFIEHVTLGDDDLQRELLEMVQHSADAEERIAATVERIARMAVGAHDWTGRRFGPYRIVREIGRGGMGLVFEASRDDTEYDKTVALKVAPDWRDLESLRERFRNERQILAGLEHSNIARFLDGGTDGGIPYFAMEYIEGKPVTEWVRERSQTLRQRIGLFQQICAAVHYAHENLIVHRDLKPANILVDKCGTPKLLDFGIATLLSPLGQQTATTTGVRLWTPDYTSPEQARGGAVTVRTDIYSLGLILYELLCDERAQIADPSSPVALEQSICETEPPLPSIRADARGEKILSRQLRGDLDTIVAMAIRKEPERRYGSAAALASDLARFLAGRPVEARPSTARYLLSKWMRRHWLAAGASLLLVLSIVAGVASTVHQARRAERRFQDVRSLANAFVFDVHDQIQYLPGSTEARKAIVSTALRYLENLRRDAGNDPTLQRELAAAYEKIGDAQGNPSLSNLGDSQGALRSYRLAESTLMPLSDRGDPGAKLALTSVVFKLGTLQHVLGDPAGIKQLERAREMVRPLAAHSRDLATLGLAGNISSEVARLSSDAKTPERSREAAEEAAQIALRMVSVNPASQESLDFLALSKNALASAYRAAGEVELSARTYRESLSIREQLVKDHPENTSYRRLLLITYGHLGDALGPPEANGLGQLGESVTAFEKATEIASWISERDPADRKAWFDLVAAEMRTAASLLEEPQGAGEALRFLMKAEVPLTRLLNEDPSNQRFRMYALILDCHQGKALMLLGRYAEATRRLEKARSHAVNFRGGPNEKNAWSWGIGAALRLAQIKAETGDRAGSVALADEVASGLTKVAPQALGNAWSGALFYMRLGSLYLKIGQGRSASLWLEKAAVTWRGMTVPAALEEQRKRALAATERDLHR
jgi:serine/threonine protein kinase